MSAAEHLTRDGYAGLFLAGDASTAGAVLRRRRRGTRGHRPRRAGRRPRARARGRGALPLRRRAGRGAGRARPDLRARARADRVARAVREPVGRAVGLTERRRPARHSPARAGRRRRAGPGRAARRRQPGPLRGQPRGDGRQRTALPGQGRGGVLPRARARAATSRSTTTLTSATRRSTASRRRSMDELERQLERGDDLHAHGADRAGRAHQRERGGRQRADRRADPARAGRAPTSSSARSRPCGRRRPRPASWRACGAAIRVDGAAAVLRP